MNKKFVFGASMLLFFAAQANAALLLVDPSDNFKLIGATGIFVDASSADPDQTGFYDVAFVDGTCAELFSGCDESTDFLFQSFEAPLRASLALVNQVFIGGTSNPFDVGNGVTNGCGIETGAIEIFCLMYTPFWFGGDAGSSPRAQATFAINYTRQEPVEQEIDQDEAVEVSFLSDGVVDFDTSRSLSRTWVIWSRSTAVTEPSALWLLGAGLIGLFLLKRGGKAA